MKRLFLLRTVAVVCATLLIAGAAILMAQDAPPPPPQALLAPGQLDSLVAPVALYPDPLLSQILVAATYPLELVQASQWLQQNPGLGGPALTQAVAQQNWDPSVQALVIFPDLMRRLIQDITWTTNLGNAFLSQQADVMDAVQRMRASAEQAGKLSSTPQQQVITANEGGRPIIEIEPANPEVIYVPEYDPAYIWGPPVYFPYPRWYYPRPGVALIGGGFFGFGAGISIGAYFGGGWGGWGSWGWRPAWGSHTVMINNNFIHRHDFNTAHISNLHGTSAWSHDSFHRQGVPYPNRALSQQYGGGVRANLAPRELPGRTAPVGGFRNAPTPAPVGGGFRGNAGPAPNSEFRGGFSSQQPGERFGNRQIAPSVPNAGRGAFGGMENGAAARVQSDHGYSSLGPARSAPAGGFGGGRPAGGGGGRSSGGGGGHRR